MEKVQRWKSAIEAKGLRVNLAKTKIMMSSCSSGEPRDQGKYPCSVCRKGVGSNSIFCGVCKHWVHKKCSGIKGKLSAEQGFKCSRCSSPPDPLEDENIEVICDNQKIDVVDKFWYLGDTIGARGGAEDSVTARIRSAWNKFRELIPLLTGKSFPLLTKGKVFQACVRSVLLYGSETWPIKEEDLKRLESNDNRMTRWMCGVSLSQHIPSSELRSRLNLRSIRDCIQQRRLEWFGHIKRMGDEAWPSRCRNVIVEGVMGKGRPKITWNEVIRRDLRERRLDANLVHDRGAWKSNIRKSLTHASMENGL